MGEVPNPHTNKKEEDMNAARHMIDILMMLEEKTRESRGGRGETARIGTV